MGTTKRISGRWKWHVVRNTERIGHRIRKERVEVDRKVEVFEGSRHIRVRQDGVEVLCAERAAHADGSRRR